MKWQGKSYHKCSWLPEEKLTSLAPHRLRHFNRNYTPESAEEDDRDGFKNGVKAEWLEVDRIIARREVRGGGSSQYLVKWRDLQYNECTWEDEKALAEELRAEAELALFRKVNDQAFYRPPPGAEKREFQVYETQPAFIHGGQLHNYQLEGMNWLRHSWQKGTNVILADEMGLGKTIQTISFFCALHADWSRGPFLLVVPLSTLRNWPREFQLWAPHLNVILYYGSQASRAMIRKYEFFMDESMRPAKDKDKDAPKEKKGRGKASAELSLPKFNVLMTSYELVLQDNSILGVRQ